ncbi:hypothetical protein KY348_06725 [Candidatus Woesearchaeota archaeon]|nr:hypothetical protein [Candidatus Woesearchaeota archaeon]
MHPEKLDETSFIKILEKIYIKPKLGMHVDIDKMLLFWEHHFDAFEVGYPNGHKKEGSLRYKKNFVRLPFGKKLLAYEINEFKAENPPRGIVTIGYVAVSPLNQITQEELLSDGFENKQDLLWQMTKMEERYYKDCTPESIVSYYKFEDYNPNPSEKEVKELLEAKLV